MYVKREHITSPRIQCHAILFKVDTYNFAGSLKLAQPILQTSVSQRHLWDYIERCGNMHFPLASISYLARSVDDPFVCFGVF